MRISLQDALKRKLLVDIRRRVDGVEEIEGIVLAISSRWILVREVDEHLAPNGYWLLRRDTLQSLRCSVHNDFRRRIMRREHVFTAALEHPGLDVSGIIPILIWLAQESRFVILRTETADGWRSLHCRMLELSKSHLSVRGFDGAGRWEKPTLISPDVITSIRFDSQYLFLYEKYAEKGSLKVRQEIS